MSSKVYSREQLYQERKSLFLKSDASEAAFLLGGIGTGNISIGARGEFGDFEIFNHAGKQVYAPYAFFAIWAKEEGRDPIARVLESKINPPYSMSHGFPAYRVAGLPRLDDSKMLGEYPILNLYFEDKKLPVEVSLEAFTPFIPLNPDDSGIPAAFFRYKVRNNGTRKVDVSIACSMPNMAGYQGLRDREISLSKDTKTTYLEGKGFRGLFYEQDSKEKDCCNSNSFAVMTTCEDVSYKPQWLNDGWTDGIQDFWDDFSDDGRVDIDSKIKAPDSKITSKTYNVGSIVGSNTVEPGEEKYFEFVLSWYFPYRKKAWDETSDCCESCCCDESKLIKNYYAVLFDEAWDAGSYLIKNLEHLEKLTKNFHRALHIETTLPVYVIDAIASNITVMRSPTCFRIEDGTLAGWEGCGDLGGCCHGNCTHVWNYAQVMAFLFPTLEQSSRLVEFNLETDETGNMAFRTNRIFGQERWEFVPAADGQMGTIMRLYREWKLSGDDTFIRKVWNKAKLAMDFAFEYWDSDKDFVLDSEQHNTYDIEFYGPNSLVNSMFFGALKAMTEMADYLGEKEVAEKYRTAFELGSKKMDEMLWGGDYYIQLIDDVNKYKYQYGEGCLSDQLLGQFLAHMCGLGYVLPEEHVKKAIKSIFEYNFQQGLSEFSNVQRTYALNDEHGLLLCTWPHGGRPYLPFVYSDEVWTGIEYQVACTFIYEGYLEEGLTIVKAVRDRHDGYRRNPWDEVECGHHYARSMASYGLLTALSGFRYDLVKREISFDPKINQDHFSAFFCCGKTWGIYRQEKKPDGKLESKIEILYGDKGAVKLSSSPNNPNS